jgi:hypothetical protein
MLGRALTPLERLEAVIRTMDSPQEGEADNALHQAHRMLRDGKVKIDGQPKPLRWADIIDGYLASRKAQPNGSDTDFETAARELAAQLKAAEARIAELETVRPNGSAPVSWSDVRDQGDPRKQAAFLLAQQAAKRVYLNGFETQFFRGIVNGVGALDEPQEALFRQVMTGLSKRLGAKPPS